MRPDPSFDGQRLKAVCPKDGTPKMWVAKYKNGDLLWWCPHGKPKRPAEVINRKILASKSKV